MVDTYDADTYHALATVDLGAWYAVGSTFAGSNSARISANVPGTPKELKGYIMSSADPVAIGTEYVLADLNIDALDADRMFQLSTDSTAGNETRTMHAGSTTGTLTEIARYLVFVVGPTPLAERADNFSGQPWYSDGGSSLTATPTGSTVPDPGGGGPVTDPDEPPEYEAPEPARALLEIYVAEEGAYLWDEALWDEAVWSTSAWTDVTPRGVIADISWGSDRAERGILADVVAGSWSVDTYDPDRDLDPANPDSPYATELVPGLPIRLSHDGYVIRTGIVETIYYSHEANGGRIRATDRIADMSNAAVPSDLTMADTLRARARDAIEAAGLAITVEPDPPGGDPDLSPHEADVDRTVWDWITVAAREVHHVPYLDNTGVMLRFSPWDSPADRGEVIASPELIDLASFISDDGLVSVVIVNDETAGEIERRVTPTPRYGARVHRRDDVTIDGEAYADAILFDRANASLRWQPGEIFPLTAARVTDIARIAQNELISLVYAEATPPIDVVARVLGLRVRVVDLGGQAGPDWRFYVAATTGTVSPLVADDVTPLDILVDDVTGEPLYPDGVVGLEDG